MKHFIGTFVICSVLLFGCKASKDTSSDKEQTPTFEELVTMKYPDQSTVLMNESNTYALVQSISRKSEVKGQSSIHFFVYDKTNEEIILEDFINQGSVEWISDNLLKINEIPGVYKKDDPQGYVFDVTNKTRKAN